MIFTERQITVRKGKATIDEPVILYRGDFEVSIKFTIMESKFRFKSGVNLVDSEKASFGQLAILAPYGGNVFSETVKCEDGTVTFTLTKEMIDQLEEVGLYSFQIRLFDYYRESRVSIPPVEFGIEVREPVASEDHDNEVNNAIVGYSIAKVVDGLKEDVPDTFDDNGNYNKTDWETGDRISEGKLNKIEDAIDKINQNEKKLDKKVNSNYNVLETELSYKSDKGDSISVSQIDKNKGKFDQTYFTDEFLKQMTGKTPVNSTVADNSITTDKLADKSVRTYNLSNESFDLLINHNIKGSDIIWTVGSIDTYGRDMASSQRIRSDYIRFNKNAEFKLTDYNTYMYNVVMYDEALNKIGGTEWVKNDIMIKNENCRFIRIILGKHQYVELTQSEINSMPHYFSIEHKPCIIEKMQDIYLVNKAEQLTFERGTIDIYGYGSMSYPSPNVPSRIRTIGFVKVNNGVIRSTKFDKYMINVIFYGDDFEKTNGTEWVKYDVVISEPCYVRFMISHHDNSEISDDDILEMTSSIEIFGDIEDEYDDKVSYVELSNTSVYSSYLKEQLWCRGSLSLDGLGGVVEFDATNRIRSDFIKLNKGDTITCTNDEYIFGGHIFNISDKSFMRDIGWQQTGSYTAPTDCYYRVVAKRKDEAILKHKDIITYVNSLSFIPSYLVDTNNEEIIYDYSNATSYTKNDRGVTLNSNFSEVNYVSISSKINGAQMGIVEFNARLTDANSSSKVILCRDSQELFNISINTTYFKPYTLKIPFDSDRDSSFIIKIGSLITSNKANCEIKDIKIKFEDIIPKQSINDHLIYIAHRGDTRFAPENTFPAFMEAKLKGYNAIETDIEVTADGEFVLLHDNTIDRTSNGSGSISSLTLEQARMYDYGSWKDSKYTGTTIPTLKEFLIWCRMTDIRPVLELKVAFNSELAAKFVNILSETKMIYKCDVISFNFNAISSIANVDNNIRFALIGAPTESTISALKQLGNNVYYSIYGSDLTSSANLCTSHEIEYIYSTNDGDTIRNCYKVGCIGICTDMLILNNCCM